MNATYLLVIAILVTFHSTIATAKKSREEMFNELMKTAPTFSGHYSIGFVSPMRYKREATFYTTEEPVCPNRQQWKNISQAITADGVTVEVIQGMFGWGNQWFYTVECHSDYEGKPCRWIKESIISETTCKTKENLVPAIISEPESNSFDWKMIRIPAQCDCVRQQQVYVNEKKR